MRLPTSRIALSTGLLLALAAFPLAAGAARPDVRKAGVPTVSPFAVIPSAETPAERRSDPRDFTRAPDGRVLFWADDGRHGQELWQIAAPGLPPSRISDFCPGRCGVEATRFLVPFDGDVLVLANVLGEGIGIWRLDGERLHVVARLPEGTFWNRPPAVTSEIVFFSLHFPAVGYAAWVTDGTSEGTRPLGIVDDGEVQSFPDDWEVVDGEVWFSADTARWGRELWATDGSSAGTRRITDICPLSCNSNPQILGRIGNRVIFRASGTGLGVEPWAIDVAGGEPVFLADVDPGLSSSWVIGFGQFDDDLYLLAPYSGLVWRTDGTPAGTTPEPSVAPDGDFPLSFGARVLGNRILFETFSDEGADLWAWHRHTHELHLLQGPNYRFFSTGAGRTATLDGELHWIGDGGDTLFATDGTTVRTVAELGARVYHSVLAEIDGRLWFVADDATGSEPWTSDGTASGTGRVADLSPARGSADPAELVSRTDGLWTVAGHLDGRFPWRIGDQGPENFGAPVQYLWRLEGTDADGPLFAVDTLRTLFGFDGGGWTELTDLAGPRTATYDGRLWFAGNPFSDQSLWASDGTVGGTKVVVDPYPEWNACGIIFCFPPEEYPAQLTASADRLWFVATDVDGNESLWSSEGTPESTASVALAGERLEELRSWADDRLWIRGRDLEDRPVVWISDGTDGGTRLLSTGDSLFAKLEHPLALGSETRLFVVHPTSGPDELWATGGTTATPHLVSRFGAADGADRVRVVEATASGGRAYFSVLDDVYGRELWITDGTTGGTFRLDLEPGARGSGPSDLTPLPNGGIVFAASRSATGHEPWISDGTLAGTRLIADLLPGPDASSPSGFTEHAGQIVFAADGMDSGRQLFSFPVPEAATDGCPADAACVHEGTFSIRIDRDDLGGGSLPATPVPLGARDSGIFWFFSPENWEVMAKVLDGCAINGHWWVLAAATTDVGHTLTVERHGTDETWSASRPTGAPQPALVDLEAFACSDEDRARDPAATSDTHPDGPGLPRLYPPPQGDGDCTPDLGTHCLSTDARFRVEVEWTDFEGASGVGRAVPFGARDSGIFWFFSEGNWELMVKVLDGCGLNSRYWVFAAATTTVEHTIRVTDTRSGDVWTSTNPAGVAAPAITDTEALATCP